MNVRGVLAALGWCLSLTLLAQAPPLGNQFPVNTYTTGEQRDPRIAPAGGGGFVVVWTGYGEDGSGFGVFGQRFDRLGVKDGSEFQVNTYTTGDQSDPSVAAGPGGSFVVVWDSSGQDGSSVGIFGQRFGIKSSPFPGPGQLEKRGPEFQINTYTTSEQHLPAVAADAAGNFVVVWDSFGQDGSGFGIFGQLFDASGAKVGSEFQVNTDTVGSQSEPAVAFDRAGNFVVVWSSYGVIRGQRFDKAGSKIQGEFLADAPVPGDKSGPALAVQGAGDFVVVWENTDTKITPTHLIGQRFDSSAESVGGFFSVDSGTTSYRIGPSISRDQDGNFVVAWTSFPLDRSQYSTVARRFDRSGNAIGTAFPINTTPPAELGSCAVTDDGEGFAVTWFGHTDGSVDGVFGRRQDLFPVGFAVDAHSASGTASDVDGVLEPGETVLAEPGWANDSTLNFGDLTGSASNFSGPAGGTYTIDDPAADYGPVPSGALGICDPCYRLSVAGPRPATHWDASFEEDLGTGGAQFWSLHVGDSFADVPRTQPFYKKIEALLHNGITSGCNATMYCPDLAVSRGAMAIFIAKVVAGAGELVPTAGLVNGQSYACFQGGHSLFTDVSPTDSFCRHVHYLTAQNMSLGCGAGMFCPGPTVTRDAMASFIAKAIVAPGGGNAVPLTYGPDPGTGLSYSCDPASPNTHFTDVPVSNPFCKHIHYLWARGIVAGCSATLYCPTQSVNRDAMAKFIANGFNLQLYKP